MFLKERRSDYRNNPGLMIPNQNVIPTPTTDSSPHKHDRLNKHYHPSLQPVQASVQSPGNNF